MPTQTGQGLFRKEVIPPGVHATPKRKVIADPRSIRRWLDQFKRMKQIGIKVPVCWGHQSKAWPVPPDKQTESDESNFLKSRYNATEIEDLEINERGGLDMIAKPPPGYKFDPERQALVNEADGTQISEVSAALATWQDGEENHWYDAIRHVALTPLPVCHKQNGFAELDTAPPEGQDWIGPATLATDSYEPIISYPKRDRGKELVPAIIERLKKCGVAMPETTTADNFLEHLDVALAVLEGREMQKKQADQEQQKQQQQRLAGNNDLREEPVPVLMSTEGVTDPEKLMMIRANNRWFEVVKEKHEDAQARRGKLLDSIAKRVNPATGVPYMKPDFVAKLRQRISAVEMAVDDKGKLASDPIDEELANYDAAFPDSNLIADMASLTEEPPPEDQSRKALEKAGDDAARSLGRTPANEAAH